MDVRSRKLKVTFFYLILLGFLVAVTSLFVHYILFEHMSADYTPAQGILRLLPGYEEERVRGVRVAVLRSDQTADFVADSAADDISPDQALENYYALSDFWAGYFRERRIDAELIADDDLLDRLHLYNLLVLPVAHCMSVEQIEAVKGFLAQRRGVIFTHLTGNRDAEGTERDWSLTEDITGGSPSFVRAGEEAETLNIFSETPIAPGLAPGFALKVQPYDALVSLALREPRVRPAAAWNSDLIYVREGPGGRIGAAYGDYMGGRFVWLGFSAQSVKPVSEMWDALYGILTNASDWASLRPVAGKASWPESRSAATFAVYVGENMTEAEKLSRLFAGQGIKPALFLDHQNIEVNRVALEQLLGDVEFAVNLDIKPESVKTEPESEVSKVFKEAGAQIDDLFGVDLSGFNLPAAPEENLEKWMQLGSDYIWLDSVSGFAPTIIRPGRQPLLGRKLDPLVLIPQGGYHDYQQLESKFHGEPDMLLEGLEGSLDSVSRLGGLYSVSLTADPFGAERYRDIITEWLRNVRQNDMWVASPSEIARWWRHYGNVRLDIRENRDRLTLMVSNEGRNPVPGIRVFIYPGRLPDELDIRAERIRVPIPSYQIDAVNARIILEIENLKRRENRTYYLNY